MLNRKKILIIDDDERNIFALKAVLTAKQYTCTSATSGMQGLSMLKEDPSIDIALVDMMMPGMDGYELIDLIRNEPSIKHLPIIAVTAQAMPGDREKTLDAGADDYISKPVNIDKLVVSIENLMNN